MNLEEGSALGVRASENGLPCSTGAGGRTRTDDLLITNQLLYQLSYAGRLGERPGDGDVSRDEPLL